MHPCPEHFIVRPGFPGHGELIVPLIAVDQLPDWIQLAGVPRELDAEQAVGLINLGPVAGDGVSSYEVRLRADKIRAIMSSHTQEEEEEEKQKPLGPSDSVSERGREMLQKEEVILRARAPQSQEQQADKTKAKETQTQIKAPNDAQREVDPLMMTAEKKKAPEVEAARPPIHRRRAWSDESDTASPDLVSASERDQIKTLKEQQHEDEPHAAIKPPAPEPMLSASRHNTAADTAGDKPAARDRPIRPHLTGAHPRDTQPRRVAVPRVKDNLFGTNPDTIYCRHWCHHGTCKWGGGCRYQHRMPNSQEGLREVGLKVFPTWFLLLMAGTAAATDGGGGRFPSLDGNNGLEPPGGMDMSMDDLRSTHHRPRAIASTNRPPHPQLGRPPYAAADAAVPHLLPTPTELRLLAERRMSALHAGITATTSHRQRLRQIKEMREHKLSAYAGGYQHQGRADLHTNASVAANAAGLSAARWRQALREAARGADAPVAVSGREGRLCDELDGRLSSVASDESAASGQRATAVREGKLVDI